MKTVQRTRGALATYSNGYEINKTKRLSQQTENEGLRE